MSHARVAIVRMAADVYALAEIQYTADGCAFIRNFDGTMMWWVEDRQEWIQCLRRPATRRAMPPVNRKKPKTKRRAERDAARAAAVVRLEEPAREPLEGIHEGEHGENATDSDDDEGYGDRVAETVGEEDDDINPAVEGQSPTSSRSFLNFMNECADEQPCFMTIAFEKVRGHLPEWGAYSTGVDADGNVLIRYEPGNPPPQISRDIQEFFIANGRTITVREEAPHFRTHGAPTTASN